MVKIPFELCEVQRDDGSGWVHVQFFKTYALAEDYVGNDSAMRIERKLEDFINQNTPLRPPAQLAKPRDER